MHQLQASACTQTYAPTYMLTIIHINAHATHTYARQREREKIESEIGDLKGGMGYF